MADDSTVPANEAALVTTNDMQSLQVLLPRDYGENWDDDADEEAPTLALFLLACFTRAHKGPDFIEDMIEWLEGWAEKPKAPSH